VNAVSEACADGGRNAKCLVDQTEVIAVSFAREGVMRVIELDATNWRSFQDFNDALKAALGSFKGHGNSGNAWVDSIIYGGLNAIEAPYVVRITGTANCDASLKEKIAAISEMISEARAWKLKHYGIDVDVSFRIEEDSKNSN
jgi:hypothetical protein